MDEITNAVTVTPEVPQNSTMPLDNINQGTVAIEASRAIAEAQGKLVIAKRFPRNEIQAFANMKKACQRTGLANKAFYSYPRGGETVSGPTIRLAEELARCWGNIDFASKSFRRTMASQKCRRMLGTWRRTQCRCRISQIRTQKN